MFVSSYSYAAEKKAYFAGGCFWCMEESFDQVDGSILSRPNMFYSQPVIYYPYVSESLCYHL